MNRRLYRVTHSWDTLDALFHAGLPAGWDVTSTGSGSSETAGYNDSGGPGWIASPRGALNDETRLTGPLLSDAVVKAVELEFNGVTLDGPVWVDFGLMTPVGDSHFCILHARYQGMTSVQNKNGSGIQTTRDMLYQVGIADADVGLVVDLGAQETSAHLMHSWAAVDESFPEGQSMALTVRARLREGGGEPTLRVRRIKATVYY